MTETPVPTRPDRTLKALWSAVLAILLAFHAMPETRPLAPAGESLISRVTAVALPGSQFRNGSTPALIASYRFAQIHRGADSHGGDIPLIAVAASVAAPQFGIPAAWRIATSAAASRGTASAYRARAPPAV